MEANFSLFWGIAVMLYEAELVSHQSKFDQWMEGTGHADSGRAGRPQRLREPGQVHRLPQRPGVHQCLGERHQKGKENIEPIRRKDGTPSFYTNGFYNVGVEPTVDDLQHGAPDPFGRPWGSARQFLFQKNGIMNIPFAIDGLPIRNLDGQEPRWIPIGRRHP